MKRLILIDAHAIIHRAYHALPPLTTPKGEPVHAVYGFTTMLLRILREFKPDYCAAAFDLPGPTFRHVAYERYKAQRPETPSDLGSQFGKVREVCEVFGIPVLQHEGFEADDIIGTVAKKFEKKKDIEIIVVTGDLDALQLIRKGLRVYAMKKGVSEGVMYNIAAVKDRYGLTPFQLIDLRGLKGDPSDNIKGVKGIGEKTALDLLRTFGSIEKLYIMLKRKKGVPALSPSLVAKLKEGEEDARMSRTLAEIHTRAPVAIDLNAMRTKALEDVYTLVAELFQKLGFFSLLKRLHDGVVTVTDRDAKKGVEGAIAATSVKGEKLQGTLIAAAVSSTSVRVLRTVKDLQEYVVGAHTPGRRIAVMVYEGALLFATDGGSSSRRVSLAGGGAAAQADKKIFSAGEVKRIFENRDNLLAYDGKSVIHFLRSLGIEPGVIGYDLMLAAYIANVASRDFSYPAIVSRELGRLVSADIREEFAHFFEVKERIDTKLATANLERVLNGFELPLVRILADMEERGILFDRARLQELSHEVARALEGLTARIHEYAGEPFNINSSQQLSRVLFEKLGMKTHGLRKTEKGGVISTRESELEKLKGGHPIVEKILEYRELMKLKTTYIDALPALVNRATGRLHTTFHQTVTATGRLSSSNPNLQNIPTLSEHGRKIRNAFVAAPGFSLVSFDYSQIELRVAAHIANDEKMIAAFHEGLDIHKMTAAEIYNVPLEEVTPELRRAAKTLNFGVLYGMGPQAFSESTGMSREEATKFIREYFHDFAGIRDYVARTKQLAQEQGYVETIFGRRRYIPEIFSPNWQLKREAERMAVNHPIQGTATGDIIKLAMIKVDVWAREAGRGEKVKMLLQVHDELVFEIAEDVIEIAASKVKEIMEHVAELKVPLVVDVKAGPNWGAQERL